MRRITLALATILSLAFTSTALYAEDVLLAQELLTKLGYNPGSVDGSYGGKTEQALIKFYASQNKKFDGELSANEIKDLESSLSVSIAARPKLKKSRHRQHAKYSKHIATPFRNLKVKENFTLIDDFNSFMGLHEKYIKGQLPDHKGTFRFRAQQGYDFAFCVEDFISTTSKKANPSRGVQNVTGNCGNMISQRFLNNPERGLEHYRKIILGWLDNGIVQNPNAFSKNIPNKLMSEWPYAISSNVPNILSHYAIYHRLYSFDQFTHQSILRMGEAFYAQWDYYPELIKSGDVNRALCNLKSQTKVVRGSNDHCGSFSFRMATGGIYFGLEFNSQIAFDTGIRHLEIMLATFNKDAVYAAQAQRGICAVGYMKQFPPHFELIHYAFSKAYGIDFINTKNINGVTPAEAYTKLWKIAHDPLETVVKYWNRFDQMNCSRNGKNQRGMVLQLKKDPSSYQDIWNGFSYEDFLLSSPILAKQELPKEWKSFHNSKIQNGGTIFQTISGGDWMGINPYLLQLALGNISLRNLKAEKIKRQEEEKKIEAIRQEEHKIEAIREASRLRLKKNAKKLKEVQRQAKIKAKIKANKIEAIREASRLKLKKNAKKLKEVQRQAKIQADKEEKKLQQEKLKLEALKKEISEIVPVNFKNVSIKVSKREGSFQGVYVNIDGLSVGSEEYKSFGFNLMIDYAEKSSSRNLTKLFRIQVPADGLIPEFALPNLEECKHITWKKTNNGIKLAYLIGNESESNICVLKTLYPEKRNFLGSIANALPDILKKGLAEDQDQLEAILHLLNDAKQQEL